MIPKPPRPNRWMILNFVGWKPGKWEYGRATNVCCLRNGNLSVRLK